MTREEFEILCRQEVREAIDAAIERNPLEIALDRRVPYAREVATQVKYLQKAKSKLPSLYAVRAIVPPRAFEQSSSEECASAKHIEGDSLLDLTCGLGVDVAAFARKFKRVVTLERDEVLADVVRENFLRQGVTNVEVVTASAEDFVSTTDEHFDWVYADPDRRTDDGKRVFRLEDCSPNMLSLMPSLRRIADNIAMKLSPLFDVDEAFRLFDDCSVEVVSLGGECKEVMVYIDSRPSQVVAEAVGRGRFVISREEAMKEQVVPAEFAAAEYRYLIIPDVSLQKARLTRCALSRCADVWSDNAFGFARTMPEDVLGRVEPIQSIEAFDIKRFKREMKGVGVDLLVRDYPVSVEELRKRCSLRSGSECRVAVTRILGRDYLIRLAKM